MRMSEKCRNNSDNPLTSRRTDGGKNGNSQPHLHLLLLVQKRVFF